MGFVTVGSSREGPVKIHYELFGRGPNKIIFVMGFMSTWRAWRPQIDFFQTNKRADDPLTDWDRLEKLSLKETNDGEISGNVINSQDPDNPGVIDSKPGSPDEITKEEQVEWNQDFQICVYDNRGIGHSESPPGKYTTAMMAADAYELLQHLKWDKVHIVGASMGGMISMHLALLILAEQKIQLLSLSLSSTHAGGRHALVPAFALKNLGKLAVVRKPEHKMRVALSLSYSKQYLQDKDTYDSVMYDALERENFDGPVERRGLLGHIHAALTHKVEKDQLNIIKNSGVPIVIITGTEDHMVRPRNSYLLRDILQPEEFIVLEGRGHMINSECRNEWNQAIMRNIYRGINKFLGSQKTDALPPIAPSMTSPPASSASPMGSISVHPSNTTSASRKCNSYVIAQPQLYNSTRGCFPREFENVNYRVSNPLYNSLPVTSRVISPTYNFDFNLNSRRRADSAPRNVIGNVSMGIPMASGSQFVPSPFPSSTIISTPSPVVSPPVNSILPTAPTITVLPGNSSFGTSIHTIQPPVLTYTTQ